MLSITKCNRVPQGQPGQCYAPIGLRKRPIFQAEFGQFFRELRESRDWSLRGAASQAERWKLNPPLTYQVLFRLEHGQVKNPEPDVLRALAGLHEMPYATLVAKWVSHRYSVDIGGTEQAASAPPVVPAGDTLNASEREAITLWRDLPDADRKVARQVLQSLVLARSRAAGAAEPEQHVETRARSRARR